MLPTCTPGVDAQNLEGSGLTASGVCWLGMPGLGALVLVVGRPPEQYARCSFSYAEMMGFALVCIGDDGDYYRRCLA